MAQSPYEFALTKLGKGEVPDRADLQKYLATGGANLDPKTTAWCAAFVNASLGQAGIQGTGSNMARSFLKYGEGVKTPEKGDLAVFTRGDPKGPYGHVGFFDSFTPEGKIRVLGGNQGNAVSYANYDPGQLLGFRRPGPSVSNQIAANQTDPVSVASGAPAPALPSPINVGDRPVAPVQTQTASSAPPPGILAGLMGGGQDASTGGDMSGILQMLMAGQEQQQQPMQLQPMRPAAQPNQPGLSDYIQSFLQSRTA